MKPSARRAQYLLRKSRQFSWKTERKYPKSSGRRRDIVSSIVFIPIEGRNASKIIHDPDYVNRSGWSTKRQLERDIINWRMADVAHDLSDCCGRGYNEYGELVYPWRVENGT